MNTLQRMLLLTGERRAGEFTPASIGDLALWLRADEGVYTDAAKTTPAVNDGDRAYVWSDQSGNGIDFVQATSDNRPALKTGTNGINQQPALYFDRSNDQLRTSTILSSAMSGMLVAVLRMDIIEYGNLFGSCDEASSTRFLLFRATGGPTYEGPPMAVRQRNAGATSNDVNATLPSLADTNYLMLWMGNGSAWFFRRNCVAMDSTIYSGANTGEWFGAVEGRDNFMIGARQSSSGVGFYYGGLLAELILYDSIPSSAEIASLENYLALKYGMWEEILGSSDFDSGSMLLVESIS
jgi:hypothetical protein